MRIKLAKHSGFCMGVRNAVLKIVEEINSSGSEICVYGPLIHNPQTIRILEKRGLKTINSLAGFDGAPLAIRTHGIPREEYSAAREKASRIINLTCTRVARVQAIIKKYSRKGYFTIIVGDSDHAEVRGLKSYAASGVSVISSPADVAAVPLAVKYVLVSQTTLDKELFKSVVERLANSGKDVTVIDTICDSTNDRLGDVTEAVREGYNTLVVIGGKNSANTSRLAKIGHDQGLKTIFIETESEIREEDFDKSDRILVTAGASTPGWIINNVLEQLYNINYKKSSPLLNILKNLLQFSVRTNFSSAIAAIFFNITGQIFAASVINPNFALISFLYIFSMYNLNNYFDRGSLEFSNHYKYAIYQSMGVPLLAASFLSMIVSFAILPEHSTINITILAISYLFGLIYSMNHVKLLIGKLNVRILTKLYNSKIITSLGWLVVIVLLPFLGERTEVSSLLCYGFLIFTLVLLRHISLDIIAFQGDLILGKESLPIWFGMNILRGFAVCLSAACIAVLGVNAWIQGQPFFMTYSLCVLYNLIILLYITRINYYYSLKYELIVDVNYLLFIAISLILIYTRA